MKDILTVMTFTMKDMIKRKSFIVSTIIILMFILIGFNIPNLINKLSGGDSSAKLLVVDVDNIYDGRLDVLNSMDLGYEFVISNDNLTFENIQEKINSDEVDEAILIDENNGIIDFTYIVENTALMDGVPEECISVFSSLYTDVQISKLGLTQEQINSLSPNFNFDLRQVEDNEASGNVLAMMLMSIVLFYAIYFCAFQVSSSITTEKTSKIMETLVTSTSPRNIICGKTFGIGIVGLIQLIVFVTTALISAKLFLEKELIESVLDLSNITVGLGIITIIYFILGYFTYAFLYALTGSTVSKPEDIQSANGPVSLIAVVGFYLSYFTMMNPTSGINEIASLVPISSPFCMPFRIMMGIATPMNIICSIVILIVTILIIAHVAIKIYSNAILNYGNKLSIKDLIQLYKNK